MHRKTVTAELRTLLKTLFSQIILYVLQYYHMFLITMDVDFGMQVLQ